MTLRFYDAMALLGKEKQLPPKPQEMQSYREEKKKIQATTPDLLLVSGISTGCHDSNN